MTTDLKDVVLRFYKEVFDNRNLGAIDELVTEDAVEHEKPPPGFVLKPGREGIKELVATYLDAFSPMSVQVHAQYVDGDTVVSRVTFNGKHTGEFAGIPATGNDLSIEGIDIIRCEGGRFAEHWGLFDGVTMLAQLGVLPPM
jgi:steroid delta-isomerase-like uncharacterized protein